MPPKKTKAGSSTVSSNNAIPNMPPPRMEAVETNTPPQSPGKRPAMMTQAQKQALMDNLQLEVTERARKLRAQYALQAQALRSRLEMRVNRIPQALRKRKMQDLLDEHTERSKPAPAIPVHDDDEPDPPAHVESPRKSLKRHSDQISQATDKEPNHPLPNPKKRAKPTRTSTTSTTTTTAAAAVANTKTSRTTTTTTTTRKPTVLSPKSHNPRTVPRSSPAKRVPSRAQTKRGAPTTSTTEDSGTEKSTGRSSAASDTSAGTTVVTKKTGGAASKGGSKAATGARKVVGAVAKAAVGKRGAATKENVAPGATAAAGGRSLRKRG